MINVKQARAQHPHDGWRKGKTKRTGRQDQVLTCTQKNIDTADEERIEQHKAGNMRQRQIWRYFSSEWQDMQRHTEYEQEDQPPKEFRDREQQNRDEIGDGLKESA